jgi:hypothetical protein
MPGFQRGAKQPFGQGGGLKPPSVKASTAQEKRRAVRVYFIEYLFFYLAFCQSGKLYFLADMSRKLQFP